MDEALSGSQTPVACVAVRPKGPTELGKPGNLNPKALRLRRCSSSAKDPLILGSSRLRDCRRRARASAVVSLLSRRPRLYLRPRSSASGMVSSRVSLVALPRVTEPKYGSVLRLMTDSARGRGATPDEAGSWAKSRVAGSATDRTRAARQVEFKEWRRMRFLVYLIHTCMYVMLHDT